MDGRVLRRRNCNAQLEPRMALERRYRNSPLVMLQHQSFTEPAMTSPKEFEGSILALNSSAYLCRERVMCLLLSKVRIESLVAVHDHDEVRYPNLFQAKSPSGCYSIAECLGCVSKGVSTCHESIFDLVKVRKFTCPQQ